MNESLFFIGLAASLALACSTTGEPDSRLDPNPDGVATPCITDTSASDRHRFECGGLMFDVSVPERCLTRACGLILDVHGFSMTGKMEDNNTRLAALGREHGYIVVNPNATPRPPLSSWDDAGADDPGIYRFLQQLIATFRVDERRIHVTGFSQGAGVTWRFVCDHSQMLASAAPAALGFSTRGVRECFTNGEAPEQVVPILYVHGTADARVDFADAIEARNAVISTLGLDRAEVLSADADHTWTRYTNHDGALFEFIQHDYVAASPALAGHCYPGSEDDELERWQFFGFGCEPPNAFDWGEQVMTFFLAHPKP